MREIDLAFHTMFAELAQRSLDSSFVGEFPVGGRFVPVQVKGRRYWYFDGPGAGARRVYVGPDADPEIARRVAGFRTLKDDLRERRRMVSTLVRQVRLTAPNRFTGDVVAVLERAGFFRLRGVLVGTVAFQTYDSLLGVRLPGAAMQTGDADFAQFHSTSAEVEDSIDPLLPLLQALDPTFAESLHQIDGRRVVGFRNGSGYKVEFLTPNRGSNDNNGRAAPMPALGGVSAQPLRFLDFLIHEPVRSVLLHGSGIPVTVPAPERYAFHKLIVASRRKGDANGTAKRDKDVLQSALLVEAMAQTRRHADLAIAFREAWERGEAWREAITRGMAYLGPEASLRLRETVALGLSQIGESIDDLDGF